MHFSFFSPTKLKVGIKTQASIIINYTTTFYTPPETEMDIILL